MGRIMSYSGKLDCKLRFFNKRIRNVRRYGDKRDQKRSRGLTDYNLEELHNVYKN